MLSTRSSSRHGHLRKTFHVFHLTVSPPAPPEQPVLHRDCILRSLTHTWLTHFAPAYVEPGSVDYAESLQDQHCLGRSEAGVHGAAEVARESRPSLRRGPRAEYRMMMKRVECETRLAGASCLLVGEERAQWAHLSSSSRGGEESISLRSGCFAEVHKYPLRLAKLRLVPRHNWATQMAATGVPLCC